MGIPVLILGESGSGKTCSLRNFVPGEIKIFSVAGKRLPFRSRIEVELNSTYDSIKEGLKKGGFKSFAIDDSQYLMAFEMFSRVKETGYNKFTDIAVNFRSLIDTISRELPADTIVYLLHHTERCDDGHIKVKTVGKMLDNQLTVEGLFETVLICEVKENTHYFITQSDGLTPAKSPMGMFRTVIDNDLKFVDTSIRSFYGMTDGEKCDECGSTVIASSTRTAEEIIAGSRKAYGKTLCLDCVKKRVAAAKKGAVSNAAAPVSG